jgi:hypothetical protein
MPIQESEYHAGGELHPEYPPGYGSLTVPTTATKAEIAKYWDEVFNG